MFHAEAGQAAKRVAEQVDDDRGKEQQLPRRDLRFNSTSDDYYLGMMVGLDPRYCRSRMQGCDP